MQVILGSGGIIATELAKQLREYEPRLRLASRNPKQVNDTDEVVTADLTQQEQVLKAVDGADVVYLTAGIAYKLSVWESDWPLVMANVINACKEHNAKLVFFDNVYAYGKVDGWMCEDTPVNPCSKKGEVRATIAETLMTEVKRGNITASIVRSADFFGPNAFNTFILPMVFDRLRQHKAANWLVNVNVKHSLTYTLDACKATVLIGNTQSAYNQIWHLPTDKNALTGRQYIDMIAECFAAKANVTVLNKWMLKLAGFFNPMAKESYEMLYQYEHEYLFDSTKFENAFFSATDYKTAIQTTVESMSVPSI